MDRPLPLHQQWMDDIDRRYRPPDLGRHWRNLFIAVIPVALLCVAFALAAKSSTKPPPPKQEVVHGEKFGDRYPELPSPVVVPVRTIPIAPAPVPEPQSLPSPSPPTQTAAAVEEADPPPRRSRVREHKPRGDICQRHGKKKVMTRGGRSWRCR